MPKTQISFCTIEGCEDKHIAHGMCWKHYRRYLRHGDPGEMLLPRGRTCSIEGCEEKHNARGYCAKHLQRIYKYGDPQALKRHPAPEDGKCTWEGCERKHIARGMCQMHYMRLYQRGELAIETPDKGRGALD